MLYQQPPQLPFFQSNVPPIVIIQPAEEQPPQPVLYKVVSGDNLTKIAEAHSVPLERLWAANPELTDPDILTPDESLKIPNSEDSLPDRPLPKSDIIKAHKSPAASKQPDTRAVAVSGNTYDYHSCTWYAKSRRPDLPNNLGSANTWYSRAAAQGISVGSVARAGAVGQRGMHVVYIERVEGDRVYLSERNYDWNGSYRERWANASDFRYIY